MYGSVDFTSWLAPVPLYFIISIRLVTDKPLSPLFDDIWPIYWLYRHF